MEVGSRDDGDDAVEDGVVLALAKEGEGAIEVLGGLDGNAVDKALVELGATEGGGSGGGEGHIWKRWFTCFRTSEHSALSESTSLTTNRTRSPLQLSTTACP